MDSFLFNFAFITCLIKTTRFHFHQYRVTFNLPSSEHGVTLNITARSIILLRIFETTEYLTTIAHSVPIGAEAAY